MLGHDKVAVFAQEVVRGVGYGPRVVLHREPVGEPASARESRRVADDFGGAQLVDKVGRRRAREAARLVERVDHAAGPLLHEIQHVLVVDELDVAPVDPLSHVLGLFLLENMRVEVLLELLVGEIDAELLKVVDGELLET